MNLWIWEQIDNLNIWEYNTEKGTRTAHQQLT